MTARSSSATATRPRSARVVERTRYGRRRLYVIGSDGGTLGSFDPATGTVRILDPTAVATVEDALALYIG